MTYMTYIYIIYIIYVSYLSIYFCYVTDNIIDYYLNILLLLKHQTTWIFFEFLRKFSMPLETRYLFFEHLLNHFLQIPGLTYLVNFRIIFEGLLEKNFNPSLVARFSTSYTFWSWQKVINPNIIKLSDFCYKLV